MSPAHVGIEVTFVALSLFAIGFAYWHKSRGLLT